MREQLTSMSRLLRSISDRIPVDSQPVTAEAHDRAPTRLREPQPLVDLTPTPPEAILSQPQQVPLRQPNRLRHVSSTHPYYSRPPQGWLHTRPDDRVPPMDPPVQPLAQSRFRDDMLPIHELDDQDDIGNRVAQMITSTLAPLSNPQGKRLFAHYFVRHGIKKTRTTLGELTLPKYNFGFISLMNSQDTFDHDKPFMFKHLSHVNEDATAYTWPDVRRWSEEVCLLVAQGTTTWDDEYRIDLLRLKLSQKNPITNPSRDHRSVDTSSKDPFLDLSSEIKAARPAPPCRAYNAGSCSFSDHHVANGLRQLHICSYCIAQKCVPFPHSKDKCKSKMYTANRAPRGKEELGFGN